MTVSGAARRLGRPGLRPVVEALLTRYRAGDEPSRLTLSGLSEDERHAIADLFGVAHRPGADHRLSVDRLLHALGLDDPDRLRAAVVELGGPIENRRAVREEARAERAALWVWFESEVVTIDVLAGAADEWIGDVRRRGMRGGVERHRQRLDRVSAVLRALPSPGEPLALFSQRVLGNPHALDPGHTVPAVVLAALAAVSGELRPGDAEGVRRLWERFGVAPDPLSSTVLALGLTPTDGHALRELFERSAVASEPIVLTLAQLRRWPVPAVEPGGLVCVVENPSLVAAAASRRWTGPPLVCSSGRPTVAVVALIRQLLAAGATALQHADFDAAGLAITQWLTDRAGTSPWRMSAADYRAAAPRDGVALRTLPPTGWDDELRAAMEAMGVAVFEEQLCAALLDELASVERS